MQPKELLTEDRAVSPVIGVILMVAITVILAAVIGTFVLGLSDQVSNSTPQAQFGFELSNSDYSVEVTHDSGDAIPASELNITTTTDFWSPAAGAPKSAISFDDIDSNNESISGSDFTAGDNVNITKTGKATSGNTWSGETVRIVWSAPDSSDTSTLAKREF